jgi:hypothetical protein
MAKKLYDMAVKSGSYTNANGDTKNRYVNIGVVMQSDDGGAFALLEPHVNLAGFNRGDRDSVMVSLFKPNSDGQASANKPAPKDLDKIEDEIPF